ncbi:ABC transporter substrate-binding protein [Piscinibacterium candidicorallinum]|uniref:ABC transporter substrate-binding protein n=1 Tax=Piscinibacterium candidicorallinum TaxID=1793872 RepID=A0ABV7H4X1_9BURK
MTRLRQLGAVALLALAPLLSPAAFAQSPAQNTLKIGFICPFSGGSADFGLSARQGAELAVEEVNRAGGFLGRPLELVFKDDEAKPDNAQRIAEELISKDKVVFTIGFCNTGVAMRAIDTFQNAKHVLVVPVSTGTAVTAKFPAKDSYIFRMSARDAIQAPFLVEEIVERRKLRRVAIFADKTGYGEGGFKDVSAALKERGLDPVYVARFDIGVKSLVSEMEAARDAGAQAIVSYTVGPENGVVTRSRGQAGVSIPLFGSWPMSFRTVWDTAGSAANGVFMVQTIIEDSGNSRRNSFILGLNRKLQGKPVPSLMAAAQSYDAVLFMFQVLLQAGFDTSGPNLKRTMENMKKPYLGVVATHDGPFSADDKDAFSRNMIFLGRWNNGSIDFAYPADARRSAIASKKSK